MSLHLCHEMPFNLRVKFEKLLSLSLGLVLWNSKRKKQTYRRILPQETEGDESENDDPAKTQNEDPHELQNVTDEDDDHGQNNNSDIYGCENISNDDQNNLSTLNRQNGSSIATIPGADELPSRLSPIIRPLPEHMCIKVIAALFRQDHCLILNQQV